MWFIHQSHDHTSLILILRRQLPPQPRKVTRCGPPSSPNDLPIPPRVIMYIDDTMRTRFQACLHQCIILSEIGFVKRATKDVVDKVLPRDRQAEDVEPVDFGKVRHLSGAVGATVFGERWVDRREGAGTLWEAFSTTKAGDLDDEKADVRRYHSQNRIQRY